PGSGARPMERVSRGPGSRPDVMGWVSEVCTWLGAAPEARLAVAVGKMPMVVGSRAGEGTDDRGRGPRSFLPFAGATPPPTVMRTLRWTTAPPAELDSTTGERRISLGFTTTAGRAGDGGRTAGGADAADVAGAAAAAGGGAITAGRAGAGGVTGRRFSV